MNKPANIDDYISGFPAETQKLLEEMRKTIMEAVPLAEEVISYGMPAFKWKKVLVYFAAHSNHIGFYPTSSGIAAFKNELSIYKGAKGSVQFPLTQALPLELISSIVKFRIEEVSRQTTAQNKI